MSAPTRQNGRDQDDDRDHAASHPGGYGPTHAHASVDRAMEASRDGVPALKISFAALALTAGLQAAVVVASGSVALLSDTLHNFSDAATAVSLAGVPAGSASVVTPLHPRARPR